MFSFILLYRFSFLAFGSVLPNQSSNLKPLYQFVLLWFIFMFIVFVYRRQREQTEELYWGICVLFCGIVRLEAELLSDSPNQRGVRGSLPAAGVEGPGAYGAGELELGFILLLNMCLLFSCTMIVILLLSLSCLSRTAVFPVSDLYLDVETS